MVSCHVTEASYTASYHVYICVSGRLAHGIMSRLYLCFRKTCTRYHVTFIFVVPEASYTQRIQKPFIGVRIQPSYVPDGWLAKLTGNTLCLDLSSEDKMDVSLGHLVRELGTRGQLPGATHHYEGLWAKVLIDLILELTKKTD